MRSGAVEASFTAVIAMVLGLIIIIVASMVFTGKVAVFQETVTAKSIIQQNDQCRALTATHLRKQQALTDTDFDGLADICDPCPNNYLSDPKEKTSFDKDRDGLSEETASFRSPYNNGKYVPSLCDKDANDVKAGCGLGWDKVRGKCRCPSGYYKDRCASSNQQRELKLDYYKKPIQDAKKGLYTAMMNLEFEKGAREYKQFAQKLSAEGVDVTSGIMGDMLAVSEAMVAKSLNFQEKATMLEIANKSYDYKITEPLFGDKHFGIFLQTAAELAFVRQAGDDFVGAREVVLRGLYFVNKPFMQELKIGAGLIEEYDRVSGALLADQVKKRTIKDVSLISPGKAKVVFGGDPEIHMTYWVRGKAQADPSKFYEVSGEGFRKGDKNQYMGDLIMLVDFPGKKIIGYNMVPYFEMDRQTMVEVTKAVSSYCAKANCMKEPGVLLVDQQKVDVFLPAAPQSSS